MDRRGKTPNEEIDDKTSTVRSLRSATLYVDYYRIIVITLVTVLD